jgi:hypothetical protein
MLTGTNEFMQLSSDQACGLGLVKLYPIREPSLCDKPHLGNHKLSLARNPCQFINLIDFPWVKSHVTSFDPIPQTPITPYLRTCGCGESAIVEQGHGRGLVARSRSMEDECSRTKLRMVARSSSRESLVGGVISDIVQEGSESMLGKLVD